MITKKLTIEVRDLIETLKDILERAENEIDNFNLDNKEAYDNLYGLIEDLIISLDYEGE